MKKTSLVSLITILVLNCSSASNDPFKLKQLSKKEVAKSSLLNSPEDDSDNGIKGKIMIHAGVGVNLLATSLELKYFGGYYGYGNVRATTSPMFNFSVDYGILKNLSAGVAFGYQTAKVTLPYYYYTNSNSVGTYGIDSWTRLHFAARVDYSIVAKKNLNLYTGVKFGYNIYNVTTTVTSAIDPLYLTNIKLQVRPSPYSAHAHIGFSYYFKGVIGFNTEVGLGYGGPYLAAIGLAVKI